MHMRIPDTSEYPPQADEGLTNDEGNSSNTKTGALIHIVTGRGGGGNQSIKCSKIQADKYELGLG